MIRRLLLLIFCIWIGFRLAAQTMICCSGGSSGSSGTVTSVGVTVPAFMSVSPATVTSAGTFVIGFNSQGAGSIFAPPCGTSGAPIWRAMCSGDLPSIAITSTYVVSSQADMLALGTTEDAQLGDVAVRSDVSKTFILAGADASILANWIELARPADLVSSVNGQTGTVILTVGNISGAEATANKNAASGYPGLDGSSKIAGSQITYGTAANTAAQGNDSRLSDARTPLAHAASHQHGGADEIATATPGANAIPKAGVGGTLAAGWIPNPLNQNTTGTAGALAANGTNCSAGQIALGVDASGNAEGCYTPTNTTVGLGSVSNNPQTFAGVVPNTAPSAGQDLVGNAGGTAYAPVNMSGDCTRSSTGAITCTKTSGSPFVATATSTDAANLTGTLAAARLPNPTASTLGGVESLLCTNQFLQSISTSGVPTCASVAYSILTGAPTIPTVTGAANSVAKLDGAGNVVASGMSETAPGVFRTGAGVPLDLAVSVQSSDAATVNALLTGEMAYSNASTNTTGGALVLSGGIGTRKFTVVTFGSTGGKTVTLTVNNVSTTLTEGTDWTCVGTSNNACASNLAIAINANGTLGSKLTATATSASVGIDRKAGGNVYALTISTNAGAPLTATSGTDGVAAIGPGLQLGLDPLLGGNFTITVPSKNLIITPGGGTTFSTSVIVAGNLSAAGSSSSVGGSTSFTVDDGGRAAERINFPIAGSGSNNAPAADAIFSGPPSTGTAASSNLRLRTAPSGVSSSTLNTPINRHAMKAQGVTLTSAGAANVLDVTLPTLTMSGGTIDATIIATDGIDMQSFHQIVEWSAVNKGGSYTTNVAASSGSKSVSAGTLTTSWSVTNGTNKVTIQVTPTTSLTTTKFLLYYQVFSNGEQEITLD